MSFQIRKKKKHNSYCLIQYTIRFILEVGFFFFIIICIPILYTSLEIDDYYDFFDIKFISKTNKKIVTFIVGSKLNRNWEIYSILFFFIMLLVVRIKLSCQRMAIVYFCFIQLILDNSFLI